MHMRAKECISFFKNLSKMVFYLYLYKEHVLSSTL